MATRSSDELTRSVGLPRAPQGRRPAPSIAAHNAEVARRNIAAKLDLLADYLSRAAGGLQAADASSHGALTLEDLPRSPRQFNGWESVALRQEVRSRVIPFFKNSNATLKKHEDLHVLVIERIRAIGQSNAQASAKEQSRAALLRKIALANRLRQISEKELIRARRAVSTERAKTEALEAVVASTAAKAKEQVKELHGEIAALKRENTRLSALAKRTTLKAV